MGCEQAYCTSPHGSTGILFNRQETVVNHRRGVDVADWSAEKSRQGRDGPEHRPGMYPGILPTETKHARCGAGSRALQPALDHFKLADIACVLPRPPFPSVMLGRKGVAGSVCLLLVDHAWATGHAYAGRGERGKAWRGMPDFTHHVAYWPVFFLFITGIR